MSWTKWHWDKFSPNASAFPSQYRFASAPYSFFCLLQTLCIVRNGQCRKLTQDFITTCLLSVANRYSVICLVEENVLSTITTVIYTSSSTVKFNTLNAEYTKLNLLVYPRVKVQKLRIISF